MTAVGIKKLKMEVEKIAVGEYVIVHRNDGEMETFDLVTNETQMNRWILREVVVNGELINRMYRYSGYEYDFTTKTWYLQR